MYLGIDLGTSEVKALVIDENNQVKMCIRDSCTAAEHYCY